MSPVFGPADVTLLSALTRHNAVVRAVLCTLARRGAAMRRDEPERASAWIESLGVHPYYKGAQFMFDLLEWEDFMLDGEPPPVLDEAALVELLDQYAKMLRALNESLGHAAVEAASAALVAGSDPDLPQLTGGSYLFPDVVLGLIWVSVH